MSANANNFAMCLAFGPADGQTYQGLNWQDADGNLYSAASWEVSEEWIAKIEQPLTRPKWDAGPSYNINMDGVQRAQAALVVWLGNGPAPQARLGSLTAIGGMEGLAALTTMGLIPVEPQI
jgi:hypothetical protein